MLDDKRAEVLRRARCRDVIVAFLLVVVRAHRQDVEQRRLAAQALAAQKRAPARTRRRSTVGETASASTAAGGGVVVPSAMARSTAAVLTATDPATTPSTAATDVSPATVLTMGGALPQTGLVAGIQWEPVVTKPPGAHKAASQMKQPALLTLQPEPIVVKPDSGVGGSLKGSVMHTQELRQQQSKLVEPASVGHSGLACRREWAVVSVRAS